MHGKRPNPARRRGRGIVVVQAPARRIPAVKRVARGVIRGLVGREVNLPVVDRSKRVLLIYNARYCVGELGRPYAVEHDCRDRDLTVVRLAARFAVYAPRKQVEVAVAHRRTSADGARPVTASAARKRYAELAFGRRTHHAVHGQARVRLEVHNGAHRPSAPHAVHRRGEIPRRFQCGLDFFDVVVGLALVDSARSACRAQRYAEFARRAAADHAVHSQACVRLITKHRRKRTVAPHAVHRRFIITVSFEPSLHRGDVRVRFAVGYAARNRQAYSQLALGGTADNAVRFKSVVRLEAFDRRRRARTPLAVNRGRIVAERREPSLYRRDVGKRIAFQYVREHRRYRR